jgi:hypothetical protein
MLNKAKVNINKNRLKSNSVSYLANDFNNKLELSSDMNSFDSSNETSSFSTDISSSLNDSENNYLQPICFNNNNNNNEYNASLPFPMPKNGDIVKSRTDENLLLLKQQQSNNFYINVNNKNQVPIVSILFIHENLKKNRKLSLF